MRTANTATHMQYANFHSILLGSSYRYIDAHNKEKQISERLFHKEYFGTFNTMKAVNMEYVYFKLRKDALLSTHIVHVCTFVLL